MRFNVLSEDGDGLGVAMKLAAEGHNVDFCTDTDAGSGEFVTKPLANMLDASADVTLSFMANNGGLLDDIRKTSRRILGHSRWSMAIAQDAEYASQIIALAGWNSGKVANGTNLYITTWFNGTRFIFTYASIVYRRFMSSGRGPDVRYTGFVSNFFQPTNRVAQEVLKPLEKILRHVNHRGCFHIHLVINENAFSVKEIDASFNTPLALLLFENGKAPAADLILRVFDETSKPIQPVEQWAAGLLITTPPYPYPIPAESVPLRGLETPALRHVWFSDVKRKEGEWYTAGATGKVGYITARGADSQHEFNGKVRHTPGYVEAMKRIYRTISRLEVRDLQYRDDVGKNIDNLIRNLYTQEWIK